MAPYLISCCSANRGPCHADLVPEYSVAGRYNGRSREPIRCELVCAYVHGSHAISISIKRPGIAVEVQVRSAISGSRVNTWRHRLQMAISCRYVKKPGVAGNIAGARDRRRGTTIRICWAGIVIVKIFSIIEIAYSVSQGAAAETVNTATNVGIVTKHRVPGNGTILHCPPQVAIHAAAGRGRICRAKAVAEFPYTTLFCSVPPSCRYTPPPCAVFFPNTELDMIVQFCISPSFSTWTPPP